VSGFGLQLRTGCAGDARVPEIMEPELEVVVDLGFPPPVHLNGTIHDH
jgi:hypothetical protein